MSADAQKLQHLARRFAELPLAARRAFLAKLDQQGIDFSILPIPSRAGRSGSVPVSHAQQRLWFLWNMDRNSAAYNVHCEVRLRGPLDERSLQSAFDRLVTRHETLRTTFRDVAGTAHQIIGAPRPQHIERVDLSARPADARENSVRSWSDQAAQRPFDLELGPLLRVSLLKLSSEEHVLLVTAHHIVCDGWSLNILVNEFSQLYLAAAGETQTSLPALTIGYADYSVWQRQWLEAGELDRQLDYWKAQLGDEHPVLELACDRPRPAAPTHRGATVALALDLPTTLRLQQLAREQGVTSFMLLLAAYKVLLHRYTSQDEIRVGVPIGNRQRAEVQGLIGFFVNTQVLRTRLAGNPTFLELLSDVKATALAAQSHADLPFEQLVEALKPERSLSQNPLFQAKFNLQVATPARWRVAQLQFERIDAPNSQSHFDLSLDIEETPEGLRGGLTYATDLFETETVERMVAHYCNLLAEIARSPKQRIGNMLLEAPIACTKKIAEPPYSGRTVVDLFEKSVRAIPDAIAVRCEEHALSYAALDAIATQIAGMLVDRNIGVGSRVGLCAERSTEMVAGMLGILKAGAVYVPIDSQWPLERVRYVLSDSGADLLLMANELSLAGESFPVDVVGLPPDSASLQRARLPGPRPEHAAYMIYTSGSTGQPKGVLVSHGALGNYVEGLLERLQLAPDTSMAMVSTIAADLGHTALFGALCSGGTLHVIAQDRGFDPDRFAEYMARWQVGALKIVPSHFAALLKATRPADVVPKHVLILGGEASHWALVEQVRALNPTCRIINHYGPTESTVGALTYEVQQSLPTLSVPIGKPLRHVRAYVLDRQLAVAPTGVPGELFLGGEGLARGYHNRPSLTAERFIPDPISAVPGARLYRTGDRARRLVDGSVQFLGRVDDQVKIRGYRVELDEVAHALRAQPCIADAVAVVSKVSETDATARVRLIGYYVPAVNAAIDTAVLKTSLERVLPAYMVPSDLVSLAAIPLTANGKLDKRALPAPTRSSQLAAAPGNDVERKLAEIWRSVLQLESVGIHDNFFELGGDSILSLQIIAEARKQGIGLTPKQLFERQTIADLAAVAKSVTPRARSNAREPARPSWPLTPAQQLVLQTEDADLGRAWHSGIVRTKACVAEDTLAAAVRLLLQQHEMLGLLARRTDGRWTLVPADAEQAGAQERRLFDATIVDAEPSGTSIRVAAHRLIADDASLEILRDELLNLCEQLRAGGTVEMPRKTEPFRRWLEQRPAADHGLLRRASALTSTHASRLDAADTRLLMEEASHAYHTTAAVLVLAALTRAWHIRSLGEEIGVQLFVNRRDTAAAHLDFSRTVGCFSEPCALQLTAQSDIHAAIREIKTRLQGQQPELGGGWYIDDELALEAGVDDGQLRLDWNSALTGQAAESMAALRDAVEQSLREVIDHCVRHPTGDWQPEDFPLVTLSQTELDGLHRLPREIEDIYPLSPMQQGLLLHTLIDGRSGIYLMQDQYETRTPVDVTAFRLAWQAVADRHPILRTSFHWQADGAQLQIVHRRATLPIIMLDLSHLSPRDAEREMQRLLQEELASGFSMSEAPLMRIRLIKWPGERHRIVESHHHVLIDAWCRSTLFLDFFDFYNHFSAGEPLRRWAARPYRDFIAWLASQDTEQARNYWREALAGYDEVTPLPFMRSAAGRRDEPSRTDDVTQRLTLEDTRALSELARQHQLTPNTVVQGAWALTLAAYADRDDVLFGVTVAGRPPELSDSGASLGLFINTIPLRVAVPATDQRLTAVDWLRRLQDQNAAMRQYEHVPLVEIQALGELPRGTSLFDSLVVFENAPIDAELVARRTDLRIDYVANRVHTNYPITVVIVPEAELVLKLSFDRRVFAAVDVSRILDNFRLLLEQLIRNPSVALAHLRMPSHEEQERLRRLQTGPYSAAPEEHSYMELFEQVVARQAERIAARCEQDQISYGALNARANRIGRGLQAAGVRPDEVVGVVAPRGIDFLAMVLGVFKAGAAYLPLDPKLPESRIALTLNAARVRFVLTNEAGARRLSDRLASDIALLQCSSFDAHPDHDLGIRTGPRHLAYVISTSGSTGVPKHVMVEQAGMLNNQLSKIPYFDLSAEDVVAQTASQSFDISVWQLLTPLLCGAVVQIVTDEVAHDPAALLAQVRAARITVLQSVPAVIQAMLSGGEVQLPSLRWMIATGEALPAQVAHQWLVRFPAIPLVNAYGPAECSDDVALHRMEYPSHGADLHVPVGRANDNNRVLVLGRSGRLAAVGATGEIFVGGLGVGRGYLGEPARTAERFVPDPFSPSPGARMYRTGDLGRYLPDGALEYAGRVDHQVKIRGFRIELGEIESQLREQPEIDEVAVLAREDVPGAKRLVGYLVTKTPIADESVQVALAAQVLQRLRQRLPDYMVPEQLMFLPRLPLNSNGKLDRKALPAPMLSQQTFTEPHTETQRRLAQLWASLLQVERVGSDDHFFQLGGHSLLATQMMSRVRKVFRVELPLRAAFEHTRLADLAERIDSARGERGTVAAPAIAAVAREGQSFPVSFAQQRLWFLWKYQPDSAAFNIRAALRLHGSLSMPALGAAIDTLIARHEAFRTSFPEAGGQPTQLIAAAAQPALEAIDVGSEQEARAWAIAASGRAFDLERGPLFRVHLLRLSTDDHVLLITMHHIVADGWSLDIVMRELTVLYNDHLENRISALPELPLQYVDYALWQRRWVEAGGLQQQLAYWTRQLRVSYPPLVIHQGPARTPASIRPGATHVFDLAIDHAAELQHLAKRHDCTLFTVLLLAFAVVLRQLTKQPRMRIGTDIANRNRLEAEGIVGFFVNQLVLDVDVGQDDSSAADALRRLQSVALDAFDHQDVPFDAVVTALNPDRATGATSLFNTKLIYQELPPERPALSGLEAQQFDIERQEAQLDLILGAIVIAGHVSLKLEYAADVFAAEEMLSMERQLRAVLEALVTDPAVEIRRLLQVARQAQQEQRVLGAAQRQQELKRGMPVMRRRASGGDGNG